MSCTKKKSCNCFSVGGRPKGLFGTSTAHWAHRSSLGPVVQARDDRSADLRPNRFADPGEPGD